MSQTELNQKYDHYAALYGDMPLVSATNQPGHPGHTTKEQDADVTDLRTQLEKLQKEKGYNYSSRLDTFTLLRFLRARKFNVQNAKDMFVQCEDWRASFGPNNISVDELTRTFVYQHRKQIFEYYPQYYHKTDKDGRPVYIEQYGKIDLKKMRLITSDEDMIRNLVVEYEKLANPRLPMCSVSQEQLLETCCTIMDMKGVGLRSATEVYGYVQQTAAISQNYYPERLGKLYIINAPWGFSTVFAVVKSFLDPVTVSKIHVLGSGYQKELLGQIPPENLPKEFGGSCDCPGGCKFSDAGPWQDPKNKPGNNSIPATESHIGEGAPAGSTAAGTHEQPSGHAVPATH